ncbi:MAG: hypothetical protein G01um101430_136 [Parcubacteria group bacterium Gr01-1014_30]|nr:MAG: hypothetical protein G01um101430_136 [Parcubacteria group bacterium Gr01-1014_30]
MATFIEEKKKQRRLVYILIALTTITAFVLWYGFIRRPLSQPLEIAVFPALLGVAQIDFSVLENPILQQLRPFEEVTPFDGVLGRENPFIPY